MDQRLSELRRWLEELGIAYTEIEPASEDASFRRYFRVYTAEGTRIVMDAPPEQEDSAPFVTLAGRLREAGLNVPQVLDADLERGFVLLEDLGERHYLDELDPESVERLYGDALGALVALQACGPAEAELPPYDRDLLWREMELFPDWFLERHLGLKLTPAERKMLAVTFYHLAEAALEQPQVPVHRDYHSRNLMVAAHNPGVLDFQDAVYGPVTYDLVSLLRDAYIAWPQAMVRDWVLGYHDLALDSGILRGRCETRFLRWFDLMGAQRHLKVLGIFARLYHRDGKDRYLADLPLVLDYLVDESARHAELAPLRQFLESRVLPRM